MIIGEELQHLGPLKNAAAAIVDYVKAGAQRSKSEFHRYVEGWTLEPDNWINLNFIYTSKYRIHVSLGVPPAKLGAVDCLEIKSGRWQNWSKITIAGALDIPSAFRCIETAYYESRNEYRNRNGKPQRPKPA